jgi:5-methyltetrahydrofolate--homocysteine methyltransferase
MVPPQKIIDAIEKEHPDMVGLSGLITPSLAEMAVVAEEMSKAGFTIPLLIGGATTSRLHTALKIEPKYKSGTTIYVKDASQAPSIVVNLMNEDAKQEFIKQTKSQYQILRDSHSKKSQDLVPLDVARANHFKIDWRNFTPAKPKHLGRAVIKNIDVEHIIPWIDWKFLFPAWELSGRFHTITQINKDRSERDKWIKGFREDDQEKAAQAIKLYDDAIAMLDMFISQRVNYLNAVYGIYEAYSEKRYYIY